MARRKPAATGEVIGSAIIGTLNALSAYKETGKKIYEELGIRDIQPDQWYSQRIYAQFYEELLKRTGPTTLFLAGKNVAQGLLVPPEIDTLDKALHLMGDVWRMNHRHHNPDEGWRYQKTGERSATMTQVSPYPDDFERGIIEGIVYRFKPADSKRVKVIIDESKPRGDTGGSSTTFLLSW